MARRSPEEERRRRGAEALEKALRRGDLDLALSALAKLGEAVPAAATTALAPKLRRAIGDAHRASQWARLHALAIQVQGLPGLLEVGAAPGEADGCRWALLWGCARSRDFGRARALLLELGDVLARCPALARYMDELVAGQGAVSDDALAALPAGLREGPDPRLGYEPPPARGKPAAPATVADARGAVLAAAAAGALGEALERWLEQASPDVAGAIRAAALPVARLELLRRAAGGAPLAPAVRMLVAAADRDASIEALRLISAAPSLDPERDVHGFALVVRALLRDPELRRPVAAWAARRTRGAARTTALARLHEQLLEQVPDDLSLWAAVSATHVCAGDHPDDEPCDFGPPPSWLWAALERIVADPTALERGWQALPPRDRSVVVRRLATAPMPLAARVIERSWPRASPELRHELAHLLGELSAEHEEVSLDDLLAEATGLGRARVQQLLDRAGSPLRELWRTLGSEALALHPGLLPFAVRAAGASLAEQRAYVSGWLAGRPAVKDWLRAIGDLAETPPHGPALADSVADGLLSRFAADAGALAAALLFLDGTAPSDVMGRLAHALLEAAPPRVADRSPAVRRALALARRLVKRTRKPAKPRARKPRGGRERAPQLSFQLDGPKETPT